MMQVRKCTFGKGLFATRDMKDDEIVGMLDFRVVTLVSWNSCMSCARRSGKWSRDNEKDLSRICKQLGARELKQSIRQKCKSVIISNFCCTKCNKFGSVRRLNMQYTLTIDRNEDFSEGTVALFHSFDKKGHWKIKSKNNMMFINESTTENCKFFVWCDQVALFTCKEISKGEQLFVNYGKDYARNYNLES